MVLASLLLLSSWTLAQEKKPEQGVLPDVLIQAEEKRPVSREKPALRIDLKEDAPLENVLKTEDEVRFKVPSEIAQSTAFAPGTSNSPHVAVPSTNWIVLAWKGELARTFRPLKELAAVYPRVAQEDKSKGKWELNVVDSSGKVFRRFGGAGLPPELQDFDGKGDEGGWVKVGQAYTAVLTYTDGSGRAHTAVAKPFALAGLSLQDPNGAVIILSSRLLFAKQGVKPGLSRQGSVLLREAAQIVQRHYPGLGLQIDVHHSRKDPAWAQAASEACAKDLAKRLLMPAGSVTPKSVAGASDLEERVDVRILNR